MPARWLLAIGLLAFAALPGCTLHLPDEPFKERYLASMQSQCLGRLFASRDSIGPSYCNCKADRFRAAFSPVELALISLSATVRAQARNITRNCAAVAMMEGSYDSLMRAIQRKSTLAATAYLTPNFVSTDIQGRRRNADEMLADLYAHSGAVSATTTVDAVRESGRRVTVDRTTRELGENMRSGRSHHSVIATTFVDTWLDADGALLLDKSQERNVNSYVDGKLVSRVIARKGT
jgi:hypothetical protein